MLQRLPGTGLRGVVMDTRQVYFTCISIIIIRTGATVTE